MRRRAVDIWSRLAVLLAVGMIVGVVAAPAVQSAPKSASVQVSQYRTHVSKVLADYVSRYSDRLSADERAMTSTLVQRTSTELGRTQQAVAKLERLSAAGASRPVRAAAGVAAVKAYDDGMASARTAIDELTPILQPELSIFEAFDAKLVFDREMAAYEALGTTIKQQVARQTR